MNALLFDLGDTRYALPGERVVEVLRAAAITELPRAPAMVAGVLDVRGVLVPVLDVRGRFGLAPRNLHPSDHFIVALSNGQALALHVDQAVAFVEVDPANLRPAPAGVDQLAGVLVLADGLVLLQDLDAFLSQAERAALDVALGVTP